MNIKDYLYKRKLKAKEIIDKVGTLISSNNVKIENTIIISGSPRSGTTWLMEILGTLPRDKTIFEPLHMKFFPEVKELGLSPRQYLEPPREYPKIRDYLERTFKGEIISNHPHYRLEFLEVCNRLIYTGVIAKFVRANRMSPWIAEHFNLKKIYVLVRHPCATIASQMKYKIYGYFTQPNFPPKKLIIQEALDIPDVDENPWLVNKIKSINSYEELLALVWALDTYIPLKYSQKYSFSFVFYEDVITNPEKTVKWIFGELRENIPREAYKKLEIPSMLAFDFQKEQEKQLSKWKAYLSERQVKNILKIIKWFDLDFYNESPYPDYDVLKIWKRSKIQ